MLFMCLCVAAFLVLVDQGEAARAQSTCALGPLRACNQELPMRRNIIITISLDQHSAEILKALAEGQTEGNKSFFVRQLLREVAGRVKPGARTVGDVALDVGLPSNDGEADT
jgi:hypothetical protein